jgi:site-specific DNA-adenine methylase
MWSYYGSKSKIINYYPPPKYNKIIEPFAGSARYSLKYWDREILLIDKYKEVIDIWKWLQHCSTNDIKSLPILKPGTDLRSINLSKEELKFMRWQISTAAFSPVWIVTSMQNEEKQKRQLRNIINNLHKIRDWEIVHGDYRDMKNEEATWFIDPPYQFGGHKYKEGNNKINFNELGEWCKSRKGQIIVCENTNADWLPFKTMKKLIGANKKSVECIWSNHETNYDSVQQSLWTKNY